MFATVNISDCMDNKIEGFGEADLKRALATFSSIDPHVEAFLKNSAEDFARQHFTAYSGAIAPSAAELRSACSLSFTHHGSCARAAIGSLRCCELSASSRRLIRLAPAGNLFLLED